MFKNKTDFTTNLTYYKGGSTAMVENRNHLSDSENIKDLIPKAESVKAMSQEEFDEALLDAYLEGLEEGKKKGYNDGYQKGFSIEHQDVAANANDDGNRDGAADGFEAGREEGTKAGYYEGYKDGYGDRCFEEGIEDYESQIPSDEEIDFPDFIVKELFN